MMKLQPASLGRLGLPAVWLMGGALYFLLAGCAAPITPPGLTNPLAPGPYP